MVSGENARYRGLDSPRHTVRASREVELKPRTVEHDSRTRLLDALAGRPVSPPPVICPGGMMTMATRSAMRRAGVSWPQAHSDARAMADLVLATKEETQLECLSVPFCMTAEAEALGCEVEMGDDRTLPHVRKERLTEPAQMDRLPEFNPLGSTRTRATLEAIRRLRDARPEHPVIGAVVGPLTLAATVMEAGRFLRLARRDPGTALRLVERMESVARAFALAMSEAGADAVMIAEPSATGEILGARHFAALAAPPLDRLLGSLRAKNIPTILHICGDLRPLAGELLNLAGAVPSSLALSVDAMVGGRWLREALPEVVRIGNVDALLLERGPVEAIERWSRHAAAEFDIVSPACGLVPSTPAEHLRAMVRAAHG